MAEQFAIVFDGCPTVPAAFPGQSSVNVITAADDSYVPYLATMLYSIGCHASASRPYDIVVLTDSITAENRAKLAQMMAAFGKAISFRVHDMGSLAEYFSSIELYGHFRVQIYYRLFMQYLFPEWDKVLYLDSDLVAREDVAHLFDMDVEGVLLAALRDPDTAGLYRGGFDPKRKDFIDNVLGLKNPFNYFQSGVMVCNLAEFRKRIRVDDMVEYALTHDLYLPDQDLLNVFCEDAARFIDPRWNVLMDWQGIRLTDIIAKAPEDLQLEYYEGRRNPAIVHFAGPEKPWQNPIADMARHFWCYAWQTPWCEALWEPFAADERRIKAHWRKEAIAAAVFRILPASASRAYRMKGAKR